ncbi:DUF3304 domain-containing protein [Caldimonas aquatica]|uniref:DUF3304 domain-containing protein n=1 Tax=Caldimonas aquatica TaxID=376175 RepID=UPI003CC91F28
MRIFVTLAAALALLNGEADAAPEGTLVRVRALNYTDKHLVAFAFVDPDAGSGVSGPYVEPYSSSPSLCCYELPRQWRAGINVHLVHDWWTGLLDKRAHETALHELPAYPRGRPADLWAVFHADGSVEVVLSDAEPDDPQWPGKVKGWPAPSRDHQLKQWQLEHDRQSRAVARLQRRMNGLPPPRTARAVGRAAPAQARGTEGLHRTGRPPVQGSPPERRRRTPAAGPGALGMAGAPQAMTPPASLHPHTTRQNFQKVNRR